MYIVNMSTYNKTQNYFNLFYDLSVYLNRRKQVALMFKRKLPKIKAFVKMLREKYNS
jgi:hypothetical protein